jgi:putative glycosyltransferase (TIGR04372 family)
VQFGTMWKRLFRVHDTVRHLDYLNRLLKPGSQKFTVDFNYDMSDQHGMLDRFSSHLSFTPEEEELGQSELRKLGIGPEDKFICFHARDSGYLDSARPRDTVLHGDWSHQNVRDASIQNQIPAAEKMVELGYFAARMGKHVKDLLNSDSDRVIDYATKSHSDFMDIYLAARCTFFICHLSGLTSLPMIFRKPMVVVNAFPLHDISYYNHYEKGIVLPKLYYSEERGRILTLREILDLGLSRVNSKEPGAEQTRIVESLGLTFLENSAEDILEAAVEMHQRVNSTFEITAEDSELQARFISILLSYPELIPLRGENQNLTVGAHFLRTHAEMLD